MVAFLLFLVYNEPWQPGLAKFGIALGLGPRDRGFKSRNPDHVKKSLENNFRAIFLCFMRIFWKLAPFWA